MRLAGTVLLVALTLGAAARSHGAQEAKTSRGELVAADASRTATARQPEEVFLAANASYDEGDFDAAIADYRELIDSGRAGGFVYFNLGNAYLRNGELGRAIAAFRHSRILLPRDGDVLANLRFARESTKDAIAPPEPSAVMSTLLFWHYRFSRTELAAIAVVSSLAFWGVAIARLLIIRSEVLRWLSMILLVVLLAATGSLAEKRFFTRPVAVVVPQEIEAHTAPDADSVVRFKLHAGTEVRVNDEREGWLRIGLPNGQQGWIESIWTQQVPG